MKNHILTLFCFFVISFIFISSYSLSADLISQELQFSGSPNPVGSGARAIGMGGAFIGVADDATAASWNPGGLIQLETPEFSIVLSHERQREHHSFIKSPGASGTQTARLSDINYLSGAYPFSISGYNMVVSLNYQTLYHFNREMNTSFFYQNDYPGPVGDREIHKNSEGNLKALTPAFAVQIRPDFSVGIALNWFSSNLGSTWDTKYTDSIFGSFADGPYNHIVLYEEEYEFDGININIGMMWNVNAFLTVGAVYKSSFDADVHHKQIYQVTGTVNQPRTTVLDQDQTMVMPRSYGIGAAWRFSDTFSIDLDIYRTDWQDFILKQAGGNEISLFTGQDASLADTDPTCQIRAGGEYLFIQKDYVLATRLGAFYDPEPTAHSPDDFFGISTGLGFAWGDIIMDAAYQFRWGNDVREVYLMNEEIAQDVEQHTFYVSLIYHF